MKRVASAPAAEGGARPRRVAGQRAWWVVAAVVTLCCVLCLGGAEAAKKKKVKTTFKALKCSACKAVAEEIKQEVKSEWENRAGDTILIEKRKKKTKVPYVESELSVQEALDRICTHESKFNMYNVSSVGGKPEYTKMTSTVGKKEYSTQLQNMCQTLMADYESQILQFFHSNCKVEDRPKIWSSGQQQICASIAQICPPDETFTESPEAVTAARTEAEL